MTDWRDLPAGRELDKLIAERLGWSVSTDPLGNTATLWTPELSIVNTWGSSEAWPNVVEIAWANVPQYSTSTDAALILMEGNKNFQLRYTPWNGGSWGAISGARTFAWHEQPSEFIEATPALAICRAWLALPEVVRD